MKSILSSLIPFLAILSRLNGLVIGAVSTDMVVSGTYQMWGAT